MDFRLTDDQRAFADAAAALFAEHGSDDALRAHDESGAPYQQALWQACVELGLHGVLVPEAHGGLGQGMTELIGVLEAQGAALGLVPLWEHALAAAVIARYGDAALAAHCLPAAMDGSALITTALTALADPHGASLRLCAQRDTQVLMGHVSAVPLGAQADHALLAALDDAGVPRLVLVALDDPRITRVAGMSQRHLGVADLVIDQLPLDADAVLAPAAFGWCEPRAIACLAALQVGVTSEQLKRTVQHVSERKQYGRAIGSFQLVAGGLADAKIGLEALRGALWQLAYRLDAGLGALPQALALRAQACDLGHTAGHKAQHVHGGVGVDVSHPMHRFLFWCRALAVELGGSEAHLARLGDWLATHDTLGWKYDLPEDATP